MTKFIKILKDLKKDINKSFMVLIVITVSIIAAGTILTSYFLLNREITNSYLLTNPASISMLTGFIPKELIKNLKTLPEIKEIETRLKLEGRSLTGKGMKPLWLFVIDNFKKQKINIFENYEGKFPPDKGEILLERSALNFSGKKINENIIIKLQDIPEKNIRITGTVYDMGLAPAWMENIVYGYITYETLDYLEKTNKNTELKIIVSGDRKDKKNITKKANTIKTFLEKKGIPVYEINIPAPLTHPHINQMNSLLFLLAIFGFLALILSSIIMLNLIYSILSSQIRQIGIMKSIGGTTFQITLIYLMMIILFSIIASLIGLPVSILLGKSYSFFVANMLNIKIINESIPYICYLLIIITGLLIPLLVAAYPIIKGVKINVTNALRDYGINMTCKKTGITEKKLLKIFTFYSPLILSIKNTFRNKARLILLIFVISISGALFITSMFVRMSILETVKTNYNYMNYSLNLKLIKPYPVSIIKNNLNKIKGITDVEYQTVVKATIFNNTDNLHENIQLIGSNPESDFKKNPIIAGTNLTDINKNEIVLSDIFFKNNPELKTGDKIDIVIEGKNYQFKIIGKIKELGRNTGYISYKNLKKITLYENLFNELHLRTIEKSYEFLKSKQTEIEKIFKDSNLEIISFMSIKDLEKIILDHMELMISFLILISFVILFIGGIGLSISTSINVIERTKEIGISRSIGGTIFNISTIFAIEGIIVCLLSFILSLIISFPLSIIIGNYFTNIILNTNASFKTDYKAIIIWFFSVIIAGSVINYITVYFNSYKSIKEAINFE